MIINSNGSRADDDDIPVGPIKWPLLPWAALLGPGTSHDCLSILALADRCCLFDCCLCDGRPLCFGPLQAGLPRGGGVEVQECGRSETELWVSTSGGTAEGRVVVVGGGDRSRGGSSSGSLFVCPSTKPRPTSPLSLPLLWFRLQKHRFQCLHLNFQPWN